MTIDTRPTTDATTPTRRRAAGPLPVTRVIAGLPGRGSRDRPGPHPGGLPRRHRGRHHRLDAPRLRARLGDDGRPVRADDQPAPAVGRRPRSRHERHRTRSPGLLPRERHAHLARLGVAAGRCWRSWSGCSSQMRRALTGRGRWLLTPVLVVLAVAEHRRHRSRTSSLLRDQDAYPAPGRTYEVGDHRLHLDCRGQGGPTVVLFNGLGEISASWARITDQVSTTTRVCAYDRAGQGWSDDVASPQDGVTAARGPAPAAGRGRRGRPLRPGRPLDRRPLRPDLRRAVPRPGRRHGAPGQLQPRAAHQHPELRRPVRHDAARPGPAAHVRAAGSGPGVRRLAPPRRGGRPGPRHDLDRRTRSGTAATSSR